MEVEFGILLGFDDKRAVLYLLGWSSKYSR